MTGTVLLAETPLDEAEPTRHRGFKVALMERDEVTAVPPEVVDQVVENPRGFFEAARQGAPGWAEPYGGPEGVAQLTSVILTELADMTRSARELRTATVALLRTHQHLRLAEIGEQLGISAQAARKILIIPEGAKVRVTRFKHLLTPEGWSGGPTVDGGDDG